MTKEEKIAEQMHDLHVALRALEAINSKSTPRELHDAIVEAKRFLRAVLSQCPTRTGSGNVLLDV